MCLCRSPFGCLHHRYSVSDIGHQQTLPDPGPGGGLGRCSRRMTQAHIRHHWPQSPEGTRSPPHKGAQSSWPVQLLSCRRLGRQGCKYHSGCWLGRSGLWKDRSCVGQGWGSPRQCCFLRAPHPSVNGTHTFLMLRAQWSPPLHPCTTNQWANPVTFTVRAHPESVSTAHEPQQPPAWCPGPLYQICSSQKPEGLGMQDQTMNHTPTLPWLHLGVGSRVLPRLLGFPSSSPCSPRPLTPLPMPVPSPSQPPITPNSPYPVICLSQP